MMGILGKTIHILTPARLNSARLPRKLLEDINGIPLIVITARNAHSIVVTNSVEIALVCASYSVPVYLQRGDHPNGTSRLAQAARDLRFNETDVVVNVQGDEPFVNELLATRVGMAANETTISTAMTDLKPQHINDQSIVKVGPKGFSRDEGNYAHIGIYGYTVGTLLKLAGLPACDLEQQQWNYNFEYVYVPDFTMGINTPEDLQRVRNECI